MGKYCISPDRAASGVEKKVIYQLFLRAFTREATLAAATEKLPHLASLGVDIIYFAAFCEADVDTDRTHWSPRQIKSGIDNPRNPYRISDYERIDPQYGTNEEFRAFVARAHELGMEVMIDLVYMHCGPGKFVDLHPDFVQRNENGEIIYNNYRFPLIDFDNPAACEYFWDNMCYWVREFDVDGFRMDVGDRVPLAFWREGRRRTDAIKPGMIYLNEGESPEFLEDTFDINYSFTWGTSLRPVIRKERSHHQLRKAYEGVKAQAPDGARCLFLYENHDYTNESYEHRVDLTHPANTEAALVLNFVMDGVAFLYNGNELGDHTRHSIWSLPGDGLSIDWGLAETESGQRRLALVKQLIALKHEDPLFHAASLTFEKDDRLAVIHREYEGKNLLALFCFAGEGSYPAPTNGEVILSANSRCEGSEILLTAGGYMLIKY